MDDYNELNPVFQMRLDDACQQLFGKNFEDSHNDNGGCYMDRRGERWMSPKNTCMVLLELVTEMNE